MNKLPLIVALVLGNLSAAWGIPMAQGELAMVLTRSPDVSRGAELYATCAACHGPAGEGASDGTVPVLAGQSYTVIAKQIVDFRAGVRGDPRMAHFTDRRHLAFSQPIADVAMYIARLPAPRAQVPPAGESVVHGAMVYARACERCHGVSAEGKEHTLAPRLASQHFEYLLQQLNDAVEGRRAPMAETHTTLVRELRSGDLKAVAAFLTSRPSSEDR